MDKKYQVLKEDHSAPVKAWIDGVALEDAAKKQLLNAASMPFIHKWIAAMPDVHAGIGATVGSVIPTKKAIIPAAVGVDIGCFVGSTLIPLIDGKSYPIKELAEKGEEIFVYSCTKSHKVVAAKATAKETRKNADLVKVVLDNGCEIICTPDHEFLLRDGDYRQAKDLQKDTSLMPYYSKKDKEGYLLIQQPYSGRWQKAHWLIARSGLLGAIPRFQDQKTIIHHLNFEPSDNSIFNLEFMGDKDHSKYHRSLIERNSHWQSAEFEEKRKKAISQKAKTEEGHKEYAERGKKNILTYMSQRKEHFLESVAGNGERGKNFLINYNQSEKGRAKSKEISNRLYECEICNEKVKSGIGLHNHRRSQHNFNHKVVSVSFIEEKETVYCLTVPEYGNFALDAGVFVHNCGMSAIQTTLNASDLPDSLGHIRSAIEKAVPHGRTDNGGKNDRGAWANTPKHHEKVWQDLKTGYEKIIAKHPKLDRGNHLNHLGTLGTGNHFIEVCLDELDRVWFMLHSGSRGVGNRIGSYFIELAKEDMRRWFINLPDQDLAYLPEGTEHFNDYVEAVHWAQEFAMWNRKLMMENVVNAIRSVGGLPSFETSLEAIHCHHNYVAIENHYGENVFVTRKGAVRARLGDMGIIPGSMGARSYIVRGKGNPESFMSSSHGAGRAMSRTEAKKKFTVADHVAATAGIECRKDEDVIDETPAAYKDIDAVMAAQSDLVEVVHTLKQVVCVKG